MQRLLILAVVAAAVACASAQCTDSEATSCPGWAAAGECTKNPNYMKVYCQKSCPQFCSSVAPPPVGALPPAATPAPAAAPKTCTDGQCINLHLNTTECQQWKNAGYCTTGTYVPFMNEMCIATCTGCKPCPCVNMAADADCASGTALGWCNHPEKSVADMMSAKCHKACSKCSVRGQTVDDCRWLSSLETKAALSLAACNARVCDKATFPSDIKCTDSKHVFGVVVNRNGVVCQVTHTIPPPASGAPVMATPSMVSARAAAAAKAFVANAYSTSTVHVWGKASVEKMMTNVPINGELVRNMANLGNACDNANPDPLCGKVVGGDDTSAGGMPLYDSDGTLVGAVGVAGSSTPCHDYMVAGRFRKRLGMNMIMNTASDGTRSAAEIADYVSWVTQGSAAAYGQYPKCGNAVEQACLENNQADVKGKFTYVV